MFPDRNSLAASLVRQFTPRLRLGAEVFGGVTNNFNLSRGQLAVPYRARFRA